MIIYPAIDLRGGQCVRLRQGDYQQETVFGADPAAMAKRWADAGADHLHIVDLDGAKEGRPVNGDSIRAIVKAAGIPCQLGGGIRTEADIELALSWGVQRVIVGTKALQSPEWLDQMLTKFPHRIILGIDAKDGKVAVHGWLEVSELSALDLANRFEGKPLAAIVYTDIARDGMMQGANIEAMAEMKRATTTPVIASGGVTTMDDIRNLAAIPMHGAIVGRAIYEGRLDLAEILTVARSRSA
jgi:phosphoribosylformimino-5-aminoimidazole carboxamide ribotide isomerase